MRKPTSTQRLKQNIAVLELRRIDEWNELKEQIEITKESLNPVTLIKNMFGGESETGDAIKSGLGKAAIGIGSGYLLKKLLFNAATKSPWMAIAGTLFQTAATGYLAKNSDGIQSGLGKVVDFVKSKFSKKRQ